jgi:hypothetical protein
MVLASIAFRTGLDSHRIVIGRAGGKVGCVAMRALDDRSDGAVVRRRSPHRSIATDAPAALSSSPLLSPAPFPAPRAHDLGRPQSCETIAARLISPPAEAGSSRSLRFK